jgi:hypothetical protein
MTPPSVKFLTWLSAVRMFARVRAFGPFAATRFSTPCWKSRAAIQDSMPNESGVLTLVTNVFISAFTLASLNGSVSIATLVPTAAAPPALTKAGS